MKLKFHCCFTALILLAFSIINAQFSNILAQGTAFTYQGRLNSGGSPANGTYDLAFSLFNTNVSGTAIAGPETNSAVSVTNGLFTTLVDFGNVFTGTSNWLEIAVSTNRANNFVTLTPRQQLTPAPYAITAENVSGIGNDNGGSKNFFIGSAGNATTTGAYNMANGNEALSANTTGSFNTANGFGALYAKTTGDYNTANGFGALDANTTGNNNTANGYAALVDNTTGNNNIALGYAAGLFITTGNNNIDIGNEGSSGDANIIRIGAPGIQTATYLAGDVAIWASSPVAQLDVEGSDDTGNFLQPIALVRNNDTGSAAAPALTVAGMGNTGNGILCVTTGGTGLLARFGNASAWVADIKNNGTIDALAFNTTSDRNLKENFSAVSAKAVLEKVVALPISRWNFKQTLGIKHIGPMAQDFYSAFNVGSDDKHIATVDEDGVALAAIQGLNQKLDEKDAEIQTLKQELTELQAEVKSLAKTK